MSTATLQPPATATATGPFTAVQKEFLSGFMAGVAQRGLHPYVGTTATGQLTGDPAQGGANLAEETVYGTPLGDVTKQERWKHEEHPLDGWDRILAHAEAGKLPDEENTFRFRNFGMFHVSPAQNSFMLRCRIPAGELTAVQMHGLADIAEEFGNGKSAVTTRSNLQIREIGPANLVNVLTRLQSLGLTAKGSGVDNIRNVTASPTAGFDPRELLDTRSFAHALHHYILNHREFYNLPRKFNVAFEGGGAVDTVADTNDIGFMACRVEAGAGEKAGKRESETNLAADSPTLPHSHPPTFPAGIYFRVELCGITGHKQLAKDCGILVKPTEALAVCAAMVRVFLENGDRTDRKKARLKYLVDKWGVEKFLAETQKKLAFALVKFPLEQCIKRPVAVKHGHVGVYRQSQHGKNYIGVVVPVGILSTKQMRRVADLAANYGSGALRLTPWQNLLIPDVPDGFVETVKRQLVRIGLHHESTNILGGLVACTGSAGCKWAATETKGQAVTLGAHLNKKLQLDHPINIHLTGCPNSCAQHYVGDIGLQGVKVGPASSEGYHVVFGGGTSADAAIGKQVFTGIPFSDLPLLLERVLKTYEVKRQPGETFAAFTRRHEVKQLQEMFSE